MTEQREGDRSIAQDAGIVSAISGQLGEERGRGSLSGVALELTPAIARARDALARGDAADVITALTPLQRLVEPTYRPNAADAALAAAASALLGRAHKALGNSREAQQALNHAVDLYDLARDAMNATDWSDYGIALLMLGRLDESVRALEMAIEGGLSLSGEAHRALGAALAAKGDDSAASAAYERAIMLEPHDAESIHALGELYERGSDRFGASRAYFSSAEALFGTGDSHGALAMAERAVELAPEASLPFVLKAAILDEQGDIDGASAALHTALEHNPDQAIAWALLGSILERRGELEAALEALDRAVGLEPDNALAHASRAAVLGARGELEEALAVVERALALDPAYGYAYATKGNLLRIAGQPEAALGPLDRAVELNPLSAWAHGLRSAALADLGRHDEALAEVNRALELSPKFAFAAIIKGNVLDALNDDAGAIAAYRRAIEIAPEAADAYAMLANKLRLQGDLGEALAVSERAVGLDPEQCLGADGQGRRAESARQI